MKKLGFILLICACLFSAEAFARKETTEQELMAAYIFRFTQFISWPNLENSKNLKICSINDQELYNALTPLESISKSKYNYQIVNVKDKTDLSSCHVLYINDHKYDLTSEQLNQLQALPILTISSEKGFSSSTGVLEFIRSNDERIRISINVANARLTGLQIDARLLEVATLVGVNT